jgi:hypothetical protein
MRTWTMLFAIVLSVPVAGGGQFAVRPGQYEFTATMELGIPKEGQKAVEDAAGLGEGQKQLHCIAHEVKDAKGLVDLYAAELAEENCTLSDFKTSGNRMTFNLTCVEDDVRMTATSEMTWGPDSFTVTSTSKDEKGRVATAKTIARRVGPCPK